MNVTAADARAAAERILPFVVSTPTLAGDGIVEGLRLKAENLQVTGSFKPRGAFNAVLQLRPELRARGVITLSAGNHGQALALAARTVGIPCVVVVPDDAPATKLEAIERFGAQLVLTARAQLGERVDEEQRRRGLVLVHPFDDPAVIAGAATVGLEIIRAVPEVTTVVVPVGGGGLVTGVAIAVKARLPRARVVGVEPVGGSVVSQSLRAGRALSLDRQETVADGLAAPYTRLGVLDLLRSVVDEVVCVTDAQIIDALRTIVLRTKLVVEPAGAAGVAAILAGLHRPVDNGPTVAVLSGGNIDGARLAAFLQG